MAIKAVTETQDIHSEYRKARMSEQEESIREKWQKMEEEDVEELDTDEEAQIVEALTPEEKEAYHNFRELALYQMANRRQPTTTTAVQREMNIRFPRPPRRVVATMVKAEEEEEGHREDQPGPSSRIRTQRPDAPVLNIEADAMAVILQPGEDQDVIVTGGTAATWPAPVIKSEPIPAEEDLTDVETISSTSTADFDRPEAERHMVNLATAFRMAADSLEGLQAQVPGMQQRQLGGFLKQLPKMELAEKIGRMEPRDEQPEAAPLPGPSREPVEEEAESTLTPAKFPVTEEDPEGKVHPPLHWKLRKYLQDMDPADVLLGAAVVLVQKHGLSIQKAFDKFENNVSKSGIQRLLKQEAPPTKAAKRKRATTTGAPPAKKK